MDKNTKKNDYEYKRERWKKLVREYVSTKNKSLLVEIYEIVKPFGISIYIKSKKGRTYYNTSNKQVDVVRRRGLHIEEWEKEEIGHIIATDTIFYIEKYPEKAKKIDNWGYWLRARSKSITFGTDETSVPYSKIMYCKKEVDYQTLTEEEHQLFLTTTKKENKHEYLLRSLVDNYLKVKDKTPLVRSELRLLILDTLSRSATEKGLTIDATKINDPLLSFIFNEFKYRRGK